MAPSVFRLVVLVGLLLPTAAPARPDRPATTQGYERKSTRELVTLVEDAAKLVQSKGEAAFPELRVAGSRWRQKETYVFVLDPQGQMLVHLDPAMEGKNQMELKDVAGRPILRGLLDAATRRPDEPRGWYHYEWPVPGGLLPRWKSSYVRKVQAPSGKAYVVGSGVYDDQMERAFVVDQVQAAVALIERQGEAAYPQLRDPQGPFLVKDTYVFVVDPKGVERVNPAFPNLEGRNVLDLKDNQGKALVREMLQVVKASGRGWVEYQWPKPGESASTQKSTYVQKARVNGEWLLVGCGVYLADAPHTRRAASETTGPQLMDLVRQAAEMVEKRGEAAFAELRKKDSRWRHDDLYFFAWALDGKRVLHAADPSLEGTNGAATKDILGRPYGKMFLAVADTPAGEGWVHYLYPEPGSLFPAWKSTFLRRVTLPSGQKYLLASGLYHMQMDPAMIEDVVQRASELVARQGRAAFDLLRDAHGPFVFLDTYVFVDSADGIELVNPAQPSLQGQKVTDFKDVTGKPVAREYIAKALADGSGWVEYHWYRPGEHQPVRKRTYVRKVQAGGETFVVGSGYYVDEGR